MRAVAQAVIALAAQPEGFTAADLAERVQTQQGRAMVSYGDRKASYDLRKMRGKSLVERVGKTRRYWVRRPGIRTLAALLILRERYWPKCVDPSAVVRLRTFSRWMCITKNLKSRCRPHSKP